jgi:hypothetical protein
VGTLADSEVAEGLGDVGLADADHAEEDDRLAGMEPAQGSQVTDLGRRQFRGGGEVELLQGDLLLDDLYELVSERQGRPLIITSNRAPSDWYPLFPNPVVAESLLDRLINTSHQVIMNDPSYRPNKRPKNGTDKPSIK